MKKVFLLSAFVFFIPAALFAKTTVTVTPDSGIPITFPQTSVQGIADSFEEIVDASGPYMAEASMLGSLEAYPVGSASIKAFPHFEAGAAVGCGFSNMKYLDGKAEDGSFPVASVNPVFHFGLGLTDDVDFIGKLTYFDLFYYNPSKLSYVEKYVEIKKFKTLGLGGRIRYHIVKRKTVIPFFLSFGGLNFNVGGDINRGVIALNRDIDGSLGTFEVDNSGSPVSVPMNYDGIFSGELSWFQADASAQLTAHFEFFKFFTFYTGIGCALGGSWFKVTADSETDISTNDATACAALGIAPGTAIATGAFNSKNVYHPYPVIPTYLFGAEISIFMLKLTTETMVNLHNREDVTFLFGLRMQI